MSKIIKFSLTNIHNFCLVHFDLQTEIEPSDLKNISPPDAVKESFASKGVILSGRGPIWLYGYLIHFYHTTKFVTPSMTHGLTVLSSLNLIPMNIKWET